MDYSFIWKIKSQQIALSTERLALYENKLRCIPDKNINALIDTVISAP